MSSVCVKDVYEKETQPMYVCVFVKRRCRVEIIDVSR